MISRYKQSTTDVLIIKILAVREQHEITELCLEMQEELLRIRSMYQQNYILNLYHTHDKDSNKGYLVYKNNSFIVELADHF